MTEEHFNSLGLTIKQYNRLDKEEKMEYNREYMYNPFDARIKRNELPMMTYGTFDIDGPWKEGVHFIANPFNFHFFKKVEIKDGKVIKAWKLVNEDEYVEIPKPWGCGEGENH